MVDTSLDGRILVNICSALLVSSLKNSALSKVKNNLTLFDGLTNAFDSLQLG